VNPQFSRVILLFQADSDFSVKGELEGGLFLLGKVTGTLNTQPVRHLRERKDKDD
jgi:hypothetical protein